MTYLILRALLRAGLGTLLSGILSVRGRRQVPRQGTLLVCCNHLSNLDPALVPAYLPRHDTWSIGKAEYFAGRGWRPWLFRAYHGFPIVRHSADRAALRRATEILESGQVLCLYPEGTRRGGAGLQRPEPGAGFLALRTGATILPVAVAGSQNVLGKGFRLPRRAPLELVFGAPFKLATQHPDGRRVENQEAADAIMLAIAELLPAELRGVFAEDRFDHHLLRAARQDHVLDVVQGQNPAPHRGAEAGLGLDPI